MQLYLSFPLFKKFASCSSQQFGVIKALSQLDYEHGEAELSHLCLPNPSLLTHNYPKIAESASNKNLTFIKYPNENSRDNRSVNFLNGKVHVKNVSTI